MAEVLNKIKYIYQFGDPLYYRIKAGADSFLFGKEAFNQKMGIEIKTITQQNSFSNGQINYYGENLAILDGSNLSISFSVPADYDFDYLKKIFVGKTKKIFCYENAGQGYKFFVNYVSYQKGLEGNGGEDRRVDANVPYIVTIDFIVQDPIFQEVTDEIYILDHTALDGNVYGWEEDVPGAGWEQDTGFGWEQAAANYQLLVSNLTQNQVESYIGAYCENPTYYLSWKNTWIGNTDQDGIDTSINTVSTTLTTNTATTLNIDSLKLNGSYNNRIFKVQLSQSGGLATNDSIKIENPGYLSGFIFTWVGIANSSDNILINTAQEYVFDLDKNTKINPNNYKITLAKSTYSRYLEVESRLLPMSYDNPNIILGQQTLQLTKNTSSNLTLYISNLKSYYI